MEQKFLKCNHCGKIIAIVKESGVPVLCCGEKMNEIIAGSVDASTEKHLPEFKIDGNKVIVNVGNVEHPMTNEHLIEWVSIQTKQGNQRKALKAGSKPQVTFAICEDDELIAVYAYCNLHGLWKVENTAKVACSTQKKTTFQTHCFSWTTGILVRTSIVRVGVNYWNGLKTAKCQH